MSVWNSWETGFWLWWWLNICWTGFRTNAKARSPSAMSVWFGARRWLPWPVKSTSAGSCRSRAASRKPAPGTATPFCAMEAVIGAVYLDGGLEASGRFILGRWNRLLEQDLVPPQDAKTALQEWAQGQRLPLPVYTTIGQVGPAHAPEFTVEVKVEGIRSQRADGRSKRLAEQAAAEALLKTVTTNDD
jgi:hypothetical protein